MVKLQESKNKKTGRVIYHINIPIDYVKQKGWKKGQRLILTFDPKGNLMLVESKHKEE